MKVGSIVCLVLGLVFFGIATARSGKSDMGPVMTDEQLQQESEARKIIHESTNPGAKVDQAKVEEARAVQTKMKEEADRQVASRKMMVRILQGLGGVSILAGIILYVLDKRNE